MRECHSTAQQRQRESATRVQRKATTPRLTLATPGGVLHFQSIAGNRAVQQVIQAKLTVGAAHDPLEREADRVADQVVRGASGAASNNRAGAQQIHRNAAEKDELQTKRNQLLGSFDAGSDFEQQLGASSGGSALDNKTRAEMEAGIGADFSKVRIHAGAQAASLNRSIHAKAFTRGSDVFFDRGQFNPDSLSGKHLLAHELTHVVQQGGAGGIERSTQRKVSSQIQREGGDAKNEEEKIRQDTGESEGLGVSVDDVLDVAGQNPEDGNSQSETAPEGQYGGFAPNTQQRQVRQYRGGDQRRYDQRTPAKKKSGWSAKQVHKILDNNLNPVTVIRNLHRATGALGKQTDSLNKWERAIRKDNQLLSRAYVKSFANITSVKITSAKAARVAILLPVQGPYILINTMRAKNLTKQHYAKWQGKLENDD